MLALSSAASPYISVALFRHRRHFSGVSFKFKLPCSSFKAGKDSSLAQVSDFSLPGGRANLAGLRLDERVAAGDGKSRIDTWISSRIPDVSRARVQSSIRSGLVTVNGRLVDKVSHTVKGGDLVSCTICQLQPLRAEAEDIPIDIVYEDAHVLVVNKPAHMVVHPAPGNANGTLVNAILHHCSLPTISYQSVDHYSETGESSGFSDDDILNDFYNSELSVQEKNSVNFEALVRPGIVHRLDKGTSGLLVIAKDENSHAHLAEQFKSHTIKRVYVSLTTGVPSPHSGRIEVPIARDSNNRIRMAAVPGLGNSRHARYAASRYKVIEILSGGGCALVEWRLETGRTHQIRAHAKYLGIPLLGDEVYGSTIGMALSLLRPRTSPSYQGRLSSILSKLERPCLHALSLVFTHPYTKEFKEFTCPPPPDFSEVLDGLREISK